MSDTWNDELEVAGLGESVWTPPAIPTPEPRYTHYWRQYRDKAPQRFAFVIDAPFASKRFRDANEAVSLSDALQLFRNWNSPYYSYWLDETSQVAITNASSTGHSGQKASPNAMKFSFSVASLKASITAFITKKTADAAAQQTAFDAEVATATAVANANLASLAKSYGFVNDDGTPNTTSFTGSPEFKSSVHSIRAALGLNTLKPGKPNVTAAQNDLNTLGLIVGDTIELEEGHHFLAYVNMV